MSCACILVVLCTVCCTVPVLCCTCTRGPHVLYCIVYCTVCVGTDTRTVRLRIISAAFAQYSTERLKENEWFMRVIVIAIVGVSARISRTHTSVHTVVSRKHLVSHSRTLIKSILYTTILSWICSNAYSLCSLFSVHSSVFSVITVVCRVCADFPYVPYRKLPELRRIAHEFYDPLPYAAPLRSMPPPPLLFHLKLNAAEFAELNSSAVKYSRVH